MASDDEQRTRKTEEENFCSNRFLLICVLTEQLMASYETNTNSIYVIIIIIIIIIII
jgi:hypothetical protein